MDINTIFYFPNSLTFEEYTEMLAGGDIAPRTIVFADAQKSIYKDGKKYGDISEQKFRDLLDAVENDSWISDELDGVKGDIIRNRDALNNLDNLIDQSIQGIQSDITEANQRISSLNDSISTVNSNLNTAISNRDAAIQTKVENLFDNAEWLSENFPQGQTNWDSRWDSDLESYLLTVGYWDVDEQTGEKTTKWSQLQSSVDSISSSVNDLKTNGNLTQAMTSSIESLISNDIASLSLGTTYATIASVDDVEKIVEWFYSGITSSSQADKTVAQMSAMSKSDFIAAISDIRTQVDKVANGDFVAQTEVSSKVGDTITNMLLQSSSDNALAALSAKANANSDNISALILGMTGSTSTANLATSVSTALTNLTSGFATTSDVNGAKSEIYSAIDAKDGSGNFISLAAVKTQTDRVANGDFVAQTQVQAKVGDAVSTMLAQASTDNALAALSAKADANSDNISALILGMTGSTSTANLSTNVSTALNNLTSGLASSSDITSAKSEIYSAISAKDSSDNFISLAALKTQADADHAQVSLLATNKADASGVVAKSELGTAVASLFASTGDAQNPTAKANVVAVVKDNKSALNLTAQDVNIDGYLTAGDATFKGDVEATSFTTGASNEVGITVLAGEFDPTDPNANTHKAYFAYDSDQGGITMWFYCNNVWKRIDLASASVTEDPNTFIRSVLYTGTIVGTYLLQDYTNITANYSRLTGKYYSTTSAVDANLLTATGYEFYSDTWYPATIEFFSEDPTGTNGMYSKEWSMFGELMGDSWRKFDVCYFYIPNVPTQLGLQGAPLYLYAPKTSLTQTYMFDGDFSMRRVVISNGEIQSFTAYSLFFVCDTVLWHAAGDPLPDGIIPQNGQTPSVNDAFAYAVWRIGDVKTHTITMTGMNAPFYIGGGNGNIYTAATYASGDQVSLEAASLSTQGSNSKSYSYERLGGPLLMSDGCTTYSDQNGIQLVPSNGTVRHIWHTMPTTYTYVRTPSNS